MFKKIFLILFALLMLCACNVEEPAEPVVPTVPEEPKTSAPETEISEEKDFVIEKEAYELYYSESHKEYLSLINKSLDFYKNNKPDVSSFYPEDFPSPENLPVVEKATVLLGWKNFDPKNSNSEAYIKYLYVIDKNHAVALTPDEAIFDDKLNLIFSVKEYISGNIGEWVFENFDSFFIEKNGSTEIEPEEQKTEINNGMELFAKEIYYSQKHDEYRSRIYARVASYKDGTFEETPNHHAPYPEDFPNVENLPGVSSETVALAWKNAEIIDETSEIEGFIEYLYFVDETHVIILTPVQLEVEEGIVVMTFAYTGYYSDENLEEWINTRYDGFFDGPFAKE